MFMQREIKQLQDWLEKNPGGAGKARDVLTALAAKVLKRFGPEHTVEDRRIPAEEIALAAGWSRNNSPTKWMDFDGTVAKFWAQRARGIALAAQESGLEAVAKPVYVAGGGAKNPSVLSFELVAVGELLGEDNAGPASVGGTAVPPEPEKSTPTVVYYDVTPPEKMKLGWRARCLFRHGVLTRGSLAWYVLVLLVAGPILLGTVYWLLLSLTAAHDARAVAVKDLWTLVTLSTGGLMLWYFAYRPWSQLFNDRIIPAEEWLAMDEPSGQLEVHKVGKGRELRFVRYTTTCPVCAATVHLERGGADFPGRLVGRCADSPREHVFSFDRVTLMGEVLRAPPEFPHPTVR